MRVITYYSGIPVSFLQSVQLLTKLHFRKDIFPIIRQMFGNKWVVTQRSRCRRNFCISLVRELRLDESSRSFVTTDVRQTFAPLWSTTVGLRVENFFSDFYAMPLGESNGYCPLMRSANASWYAAMLGNEMALLHDRCTESYFRTKMKIMNEYYMNFKKLYFSAFSIVYITNKVNFNNSSGKIIYAAQTLRQIAAMSQLSI